MQQFFQERSADPEFSQKDNLLASEKEWDEDLSQDIFAMIAQQQNHSEKMVEKLNSKLIELA